MAYTILNGNNIEVLKTFPDNHFDSIVTDPPYGIDFLGKDWDANTGALETYQECLRVLKPGGHILAFSAARTYHHLAITLEQAGFEIRDQIMWIYSSGFPKSQDVGRQIQKKLGVKETKKNPNARSQSGDSLYDSGHQKEVAGEDVVCTDPAAQAWSGWGTALKPAHEPIALARKPLDKGNTIAKNCEQWGVGALNIDATRVPFADENDQPSGGENGWSRVGFSEQPVEKYSDQKKKKSDVEIYLNNKRGPMERSTAEDGENIGMFDGGVGYKTIKREVDPAVDLPSGRFPSNVIGEIAEPYQKYFYCPKVGRKERHIGHTLPDAVPFNSPGEVRNHPLWDASIGTNAHRLKEKIRKTQAPTGHIKGPYDENGNRLAVTLNNANLPGNNHPTVKPIELMKYLIKLVTPAGGHILDPFNGSGSTGCAAVELDYDYTGIELDPAYVEIAERRIAAWYATTHPLEATGLFE